MIETTTLQTVYERAKLAIGYGFRFLIVPYLFLELLASRRLVPLAILLAILYAYIFRAKGKRTWPIGKLWVAFWLVALFVRVDISLINLPGPPRLVRYLTGLPSHSAFQMAERGEAVLHGCVVSGLEPSWIVVW